MQSIPGIAGSFTYDNNGNLLTGDGSTVSWTSFNLPASISKSGTTLNFTYNADHERIKQVGPGESIIYLNPRIDLGNHYEKKTKTTHTEHHHYINLGKRPIALYITSSILAPSTRFFHLDHLGSIAAVTSGDTANAGALIERFSYDAWGKRRNVNGTDATTSIHPQTTHHGFTGHEHLDEVGLIHMNGRIYHPGLGRFLSADPYIQDPTNSQSLNRYSYVLNNPLSYIDPSGFISLKKLFRKLKRYIRPIIAIAAAYFTYGAASHWLAASGSGVFATTSTVVGYGAVLTTTSLTAAGYAAAGAIAGFVGGAIATGTLEGAAQGALSGGLFGWAGTVGEAHSFARYAAHAFAGCAGSAAGGGDCGDGALSAGFSQFAGPRLGNWGPAGNVVKAAVLGGTTAELGGGKFQNGAKTYAFLRLFDETADYYRRRVGYSANPLPGDNQPGRTTYDFDPGTGQQYPDTWGMNVVGNNDLTSICRQGSTCSKLLNLIPIVNATAGLHDHWFNAPRHADFNFITNVGTMLPAAAISVGAVIGNFTQGWDNHRWLVDKLIVHRD